MRKTDLRAFWHVKDRKVCDKHTFISTVRQVLLCSNEDTTLIISNELEVFILIRVVDIYVNFECFGEIFLKQIVILVF